MRGNHQPFEVDLEPQVEIDPEEPGWLESPEIYCALGQRFTFRTNTAPLADWLAKVYHAARCDAPDFAGQVTTISVCAATERHAAGLFIDGRLTYATPAGFGLLSWASSSVNRLVTQQRSHRVILHAAAVARGEHAVVLPAAMNAGKSTLTTALVERGFGYLTDEAVELPPDDPAEITGLAKPIALDHGSFEVLAHLRRLLPEELPSMYFARRWFLDAGDVGTIHSGPARARTVIFPRYQAGVPTDLRGLSLTEAVQRASEMTFGSNLEPGLIVRRCVGLLSGADVMSLTYSDLDEACRRVERLVANG